MFSCWVLDSIKKTWLIFFLKLKFFENANKNKVSIKLKRRPLFKKVFSHFTSTTSKSDSFFSNLVIFKTTNNHSIVRNTKLLIDWFCKTIFCKNNPNDDITELKESGIRTHNDGFEDRNFTVKLFPLK